MMPDEQKKKISAANLGKKRSPEICAKLSEQRRGRPRKPHTPETIEKIRQSNLGIKKRKMTDLEREIHSERVRQYWANLTPEQRKLRSIKNKGG